MYLVLTLSVTRAINLGKEFVTSQGKLIQMSSKMAVTRPYIGEAMPIVMGLYTILCMCTISCIAAYFCKSKFCETLSKSYSNFCKHVI